jgi:phospholipid/cholesterol/gamma-HCH transport system substrate-binding protein
METQARYALIGLFTLAVTGAAFGFVYWLNTTGALHQRTLYRVRFESSVSGLLIGSAVLFNGVRVGEVTSLELNQENPRQVMATIAVEAGTPVRADTKAGIDFQGLIGLPAISLTGGSSPMPVAAASRNETPILAADPASGQSVTDAAREVLRNIDKVISDNAESLRSTISNLAKFSEALGRNSDRVDGVIAGLERITGGAAKAPPAAYDLTAPRSFPSFDKPPSVQLLVLEPTALYTLAQDKILLRGDAGLNPISGDAKWSDMLPNVFQSTVIQSFENANFLREVSRPVEGLAGDFQLMTDLRSFEIVASPEPKAEVEIAAKVLGREGRIIAARIFHASVPVKSTGAAAAAAAIDAAFGSVATDLVVWTSAAIRGAS